MTNLQAVREKVIAAVPGIPTREYIDQIGNEPATRHRVPIRPITLADVLLAMEKADQDWSIYSSGEFYREWTEDAGCGCCHDDRSAFGPTYNLSDNNLDNQSPETIQFLADVLCRKEHVHEEGYPKVLCSCEIPGEDEIM